MVNDAFQRKVPRLSNLGTFYKKSFLPQSKVYINYKIFFFIKILCFIPNSQKNISLTAIISSSLLIASDEIPPCVIK